MFVQIFQLSAPMVVDRLLVLDGLTALSSPATDRRPARHFKSSLTNSASTRLPRSTSYHRVTALHGLPAPSSFHAAVDSLNSLSVTQHSLLLGASLPTPSPSSVPLIEQLDELVFQVSQWANDLLVSSLSLSAASSSPDLALGQSALLAALVAGLATSLSPCTISVLPLTVGYIAGVEPGRSQSSVSLDASLFVSGLATTRVAMGVAAALAGKLYGQAFGDELGFFLPLMVAAVALAMGLNLLGLLNVRLPSFLGDFDATEAAGKLPRPLQMYLAGLAFALVASPCATPVLASLLAFVAATKVSSGHQPDVVNHCSEMTIMKQSDGRSALQQEGMNRRRWDQLCPLSRCKQSYFFVVD